MKLILLCLFAFISSAYGNVPEAATKLKNELIWLQGKTNQAHKCIDTLANTKLPQIASMINKIGQVSRDANTIKPLIFGIYDIATAALLGPLIPVILPLKNEFDPIRNDIDHIVNRVGQIYNHIKNWPGQLIKMKDKINDLTKKWQPMLNEMISLGLSITGNAAECFKGPNNPVIDQFGSVLALGSQAIESQDIQQYKQKLVKAVAACEKVRDVSLPNFNKEIGILRNVANYVRPISDFLRKVNSVLGQRVCIPNPVELVREHLSGENLREKAERVREVADKINPVRIIRRIRFGGWGKRRRRVTKSEDDITLTKEEAIAFLNKRAASLCVSVRDVLKGTNVAAGALKSLANKAIQGITGSKPSFNVANKISGPIKEAKAMLDKALSCVSKLPVGPSNINELIDWVLKVDLPLQCPRDLDKLVEKLCTKGGIVSALMSGINIPGSCQSVSVNVKPPKGLAAFNANFGAICKF